MKKKKRCKHVWSQYIAGPKFGVWVCDKCGKESESISMPPGRAG